MEAWPQVRPALEDEAPRIREICETAYRATYTDLLPDPYIERVIAEFYREDRVRREVEPAPPGWLGYQVVTVLGEVLGAAGGGMTGERVGELFVLYLDPDHRGRGLGTALLDRVTEQLREVGAEEMWVSVVPGNELAVPFYKARGFEPVEVVSPAYGSLPEEEISSLRMRRPLG